ncbi:MAG: hypothetical protein ACT6Q8_19730 [Niveispirillum sp.]|uniref:hypothetical protein n=1 Tax=Niveispirillum sp. TaxID=1917217 RepID=UPI004035C1B4
MDISTIAGLTISGLSLVNDLGNTIKDLRSWSEQDIEVDSDWLRLAISKGVLDGSEADYAWLLEKRLPSMELTGTHQAVVAVNTDKRIKYRIFLGNLNQASGRCILVRKL